MNDRLLLSPPHLDGDERALLLEAFDSNWIAPVGPQLTAFEQELAAKVDRRHTVGLASGTAALHLGLLTLGVKPGDEVLVPTLTFAATANAVMYTGATPVFVDADPTSWNLDVERVAHELQRRASASVPLPAAIIPVDLYGRCADYTALLPLAEHYGIPVLADAAESLGAAHAGRPAGSFGVATAFSFNGNKIITTSGGGMFATDDEALANRVRHLATQAREPALHYEHEEVGYNYRLSNLLAAIGRGQLRQLDQKVEKRRAIFSQYRTALAHHDAVSFLDDDSASAPNCWLTTLLLDDRTTRDAVITALDADNIESRPCWKPMHLQPVFAKHRVIGGEVAADVFDRGICLPSGDALTSEDVGRVCDGIEGVLATCKETT